MDDLEPSVALRKESVDRNREVFGIPYSAVIVALRKESVDRNLAWDLMGGLSCKSLSARRAWIEIGGAGQLIKSSMSLSARRAWIEIASCWRVSRYPLSLSARRAWIEINKQSL